MTDFSNFLHDIHSWKRKERATSASRLPLSIGALILTVALPVGAGEPAANSRPRVDRLGDTHPPSALFRIGTTRLHLDRRLETIAVSPDGKLVAAASHDRLGVWEVANGNELVRVDDAIFIALLSNNKLLFVDHESDLRLMDL